MHLDAVICLVEDNRPIAACNHGLFILVSHNFPELGQYCAHVADLGAPKRPTVLKIKILVVLEVALIGQVAFSRAEFFFHVDPLLYIGLEVQKRCTFIWISFDNLANLGEVYTNLKKLSVCESDYDCVGELRFHSQVLDRSTC